MKKSFSKPVKQIDFVPFCPLHEKERELNRQCEVDAQSKTAKLVALAVCIATAAVILLIGGAS